MDDGAVEEGEQHLCLGDLARPVGGGQLDQVAVKHDHVGALANGNAAGQVSLVQRLGSVDRIGLDRACDVYALVGVQNFTVLTRAGDG